jgi:polyisoprenoid-binding protein YceI
VPSISRADVSQWTPDLIHSRAEFTVSHMVVSKVWGHIPIRKLVLQTTPGAAMPQSFEVVLDPAKLDTDQPARDEDLRSATYFDIAKYPTIQFRSTKVVVKDANDAIVNGDLTIKNVTKPVAIPLHIEGVIPDGTGSRVGYSGEVHVDRRDFGITDARLMSGVLFVGYDVDIKLTVEATSDTRIKS